MSKIEDFGFLDEPKPEKTTGNVLTMEEVRNRMASIEELIMPLLANLHITADKPTINWPNRKAVLEEKMKELLALTRF